jgi:hypothetical protein
VKSGRRGPGRPPCCPQELAIHVIELHRRGLSYSKIATQLNDEGRLTPGGRPRWAKSTVDRLLHTRYACNLMLAPQLKPGCGLEGGGEVVPGGLGAR